MSFQTYCIMIMQKKHEFFFLRIQPTFNFSRLRSFYLNLSHSVWRTLSCCHFYSITWNYEVQSVQKSVFWTSCIDYLSLSKTSSWGTAQILWTEKTYLSPRDSVKSLDERHPRRSRHSWVASISCDISEETWRLVMSPLEISLLLRSRSSPDADTPDRKSLTSAMLTWRSGSARRSH